MYPGTNPDRARFGFLLPMLGALLLPDPEAVSAPRWPAAEWEIVDPTEANMDPGLLAQAREQALKGGGAGCVIRGGRMVFSWGNLKQRYDLKSTTKSIGATALGLAIADGRIHLSDRAAALHPAFGVPPAVNQDTGWLTQVTVLHLATHTAGFAKSGGYTKLLFEPGTRWAYSDGGPNWLAEILTLLYERDLSELMFERVFTPLGIAREDLTWRRHGYRPATLDGVPSREFGSGIHANVDAMARIGLLYLRGGRWKDRQLIPAGFVQQVRTPDKKVVGLPEEDPNRYGNASDHYGLLWWNNADGTLGSVPRDAYWSWGLHESLIVVIPGLDLVAARAGRGWNKKWSGHYEVLKPFLEPLVAAAKRPAAADGGAPTPPYPPSPRIGRIVWAPTETIRREARGSDNWPLTWADDDALYTAYGDGQGFSPGVGKKLSLGLARITGGPRNWQGTNLRSASGERTGDGKRGLKASGMLMVDHVLYMLVRNAHNSQLTWSADHGRWWTWSEWRFSTSFGYPTFLNFGRNYAGARDGYVYIYSHDSDSAYERADGMVLARVPRTRIKTRESYRFFAGRDEKGNPRWSADIAARQAVFVHPGNCYRSSVSYNAVLGRYFWCQTGPGTDPRFAGGLGIYDAPEPWGPWTTVFFTPRWDVAPGETSSLPPKWMSKDGRDMHLVFSGKDSFSVRKMRVELTEEPRPDRPSRQP